jgi:hypothetical protein
MCVWGGGCMMQRLMSHVVTQCHGGALGGSKGMGYMPTVSWQLHPKRLIGQLTLPNKKMSAAAACRTLPSLSRLSDSGEKKSLSFWF